MEDIIPRRRLVTRNKKLATKKQRGQAEFIKRVTFILIATGALLALIMQPLTVTYYEAEPPETTPHIEIEVSKTYAATRYYQVTGYNTVPEQTDSTPCIAASGHNICGRKDVAACPRAIPLGTKIEIDGEQYICLDRLALKYDHRIDISCDKDKKCPALVTGNKEVKIIK